MRHQLTYLGRAAVFFVVIYMAISVVMTSLALYDPLLAAAYHANEAVVLMTYPIGDVMFLINFWRGFAVILVMTYAVNAFWLYQASCRAREIEPVRNRIEPAWVVAWFAVPVANLIMPFRGVRETWSSFVRPGQLDARAPVFFWIWWATWIIAEVLGNMVFPLLHADNMAGAKLAVWLDVATTPFLLVSAVLWIRIIRDVTLAQIQIGEAEATA